MSCSTVSDAITSTSCGFVLQQVVRLAVRLADCCMQLSVDWLWTCCAISCPTCCRTCCLFYNLLWTCCWLSICCGSVVQQVVRLAARLADCCMQLVVDSVADCCTTCCHNKLYNKSAANRSRPNRVGRRRYEPNDNSTTASAHLSQRSG